MMLWTFWRLSRLRSPAPSPCEGQGRRGPATGPIDLGACLLEEWTGGGAEGRHDVLVSVICVTDTLVVYDPV